MLLLLLPLANFVQAAKKKPRTGASESTEPLPPNAAAVLKQIQLLNQVPQGQINDGTDPAYSILKTIYDIDGPDFLTVKKLLIRPTVRNHLNASAQCILAGIVSLRWDTFTLSGNLYLEGLRSPNAELGAKARKRLIHFIQPTHIPQLIELLSVPGPNVLAYEVLQEATGKTFDPNVGVWRLWWKKNQAKVDVVGHLLQDTKELLEANAIALIPVEKFWYVPQGITDTHIPMAKRSAKDQTSIRQWTDWANNDVKRYLDDWATLKLTLDRLTHQPDPRVRLYLERLASEPGYGDYASIVLAWRSSQASLPALHAAYQSHPTVSRVLARGSLGDPSALEDLLAELEKHEAQPLSFAIMDDNMRGYSQTLHTLGIVPAEQAFELLTHHVFDFDGAVTKREKKKAVELAKRWLKEHQAELVFDKRRGYFSAPQTPTQ